MTQSLYNLYHQNDDDFTPAAYRDDKGNLHIAHPMLTMTPDKMLERITALENENHELRECCWRLMQLATFQDKENAERDDGAE